MSNAPLSDDELPATGDPLPEEEPSWLERLLARFGLGEEPDLREVIEDALARGKEAGGDTFSAQERAMLRNILRFGKLTSKTSWFRAPTSSPLRTPSPSPSFCACSARPSIRGFRSTMRRSTTRAA